jgi:rsbT co-antagonist protein RsbR
MMRIVDILYSVPFIPFVIVLVVMFGRNLLLIFVTIGVDLGKMNTVGDLQGGIEQAERLLGYKVVTLAESR